MFMFVKTSNTMKYWPVLLIGTCIIACNCTHKSEIKQPIDQVQKQTLADCDSCKVDNYRYLLFDSTSQAAVLYHSFLLCINKECSKNIEFSEFSNVLLFSLLEEKTELMLKVLKENKDINLDYILFFLENPLYEDIKIKKIINNIEMADGDIQIKEKLVLSLAKALDKI